MSKQDYRSTILTALGSRSTYWLAKAAGVPQSMLHKWLTGKQQSINSDSLAKVAGVLGVEFKKGER